MADTDIKLSVDLDVASAEQTAQSLQKEIEGIFKNRKTEQSASLTQLELQMKQSVQKAQALKQELNKISQQKIPTEEYKEVSKRLEKLNAQFDKLLIKQDTMQELGQTSGPAWEKLNIQMEQLGTLIREDTAELQQLVDTGKAFTLGSQTEAFKRTQTSLDAVNDKMKQQIVRHREVEDAEERKAQKTEEANNRIEKSNSEATHSYRRACNTARNMAREVSNAFTRRLLPSIRSVRNAVTRMGHSFTRGLQPATKSVKRLAMRFLMLSLGARSMFALLRKVRTAIVKSFEDLQKSGVSPITKQIKELKATLNQVKSSFVAAFEPIIAMILPYLQRMAEALGNVIDKLAQFIAVLSGKNKYIRAIKQVGDAVEESGNEANGSLASFDKLNDITLGKKDTEYEEVEVDESVASAAITVKEKLDEILEDFRNFKKQIKGIIDKIKIGDWLGAGADLGTLVDNLLSKLTEKIKNFIPSSADAKKLGEAIASFLKNAHLLDHIGDAVDILCNVIKAIFTAAFTTIREFSPQEWSKIGQKIMDNIIKIFDTITKVLKEVPVEELAGFAKGLLSKSWDVAKSIATTLKTLFVKAFSILWTTLTGTELSEGAAKALGEAANIALLAIGIGRVVRAIIGGSGVTGLTQAFKEKDDAFNRQQKPLENEVSGMGRLWGGIRNVGRALGNNLIPLIIGTTGIISLFNSETDTATTETSEFGDATEDLGKIAKEAQPSIEDLGKEIKNEGKKADKSANQTYVLKGKIQDIANLGSNNYTLSGIQAVSNMLAAIGTSASNSRSEIELLQNSLNDFNQGSSAGNTQIMKGTSGVTYNTKTGKVNSPTSDISREINVDDYFTEEEIYKQMENMTPGAIDNISKVFGIDKDDLYLIAGAALVKAAIDSGKIPPSGGSTTGGSNVIKFTKKKKEYDKKKKVSGGDTLQKFTELSPSELEFFTKDQYVNQGYGISKVAGLTSDQVVKLLEVYNGDVQAATNAYRAILSLNPQDYKYANMGGDMYTSQADVKDLVAVAKTLGLSSVSTSAKSISSADADKLRTLGTAGAVSAGILAFIKLLATYFSGVPALARGGVIPAGKPFLAMLGDQKSGTNVEAPLDTIKQALAEVLAEVNMGATFQIIGDPHGMFKVVQKEANNYSKATGKLAF